MARGNETRHCGKALRLARIRGGRISGKGIAKVPEFLAGWTAANMGVASSGRRVELFLTYKYRIEGLATSRRGSLSHDLRDSFMFLRSDVTVAV